MKPIWVPKKNVGYYAFQLGFTDIYFWLEQLKSYEYLWLLDSIDYDNIHSLTNDEIEYHLELKDGNEAKMEIYRGFKLAFEEFRNQPYFNELKQIPCSMEEFLAETKGGSKPIMEFILEKVDDHAFNYVLPLQGCSIFWFDDYFYKYQNSKFEPLSGSEWALFQSQEPQMSKDASMKFKIVDEQMRLAVLLAN